MLASLRELLVAWMSLIGSAVFTFTFFRPLTKSLGEVGFLHTDLWSNNLLKKGNAIIAIDFETATTGNIDSEALAMGNKTTEIFF